MTFVATWDVEVENLERRKARRPWSDLRPGAQSSKFSCPCPCPCPCLEPGAESPLVRFSTHFQYQVGNLTKHRCRFRRIILYSSSRMAMDMKERAELIAKQEEAMRVSQRANSHISAGESHSYVVTCHMWLSQRASGHMSAVSQITTQMVTPLWKKSKFQ